MRRLGMALLALLGLSLLLGAGVYQSTPSASDLPQIVARLSAGSGYPVLQPDQLPDRLIEALVDTEDQSFFEHHGIDSAGVVRAVYTDVRELCLCEGASTLTQQLAKMAYYPGLSRVDRKLPDIMVAVKIERLYSKRQILAFYWSLTPTGMKLQGAQQAALTYFGTDRLAQLSWGQSALLAGMPLAPSLLDPRFHPQAALERRHQVLQRLYDLGHITQAEMAAADSEPLLGQLRYLG